MMQFLQNISCQARVVGTEAAQYQSKAINNNKNKVETSNNFSDSQDPCKIFNFILQRAPKTDWRKKREEFIHNLRAAKEAQKFLAKGGNVRDLPPPPPSDTSDYIQCQYCNRKYDHHHPNFTTKFLHCPLS